MQNSVPCIRITSLYGSQPSSVVLCVQKRDFRTRIACLYGSQHSSAVLCSQMSDFRTLVACLHWSQTTPVILCLQNGVPSIRITSLYGFQPSSVVFGCKTATLERNNKSLWVPDLICGFVHSRVTLGPELYVSMDPSPHLWFMHAKQRLLDQNTSLYG